MARKGGLWRRGGGVVEIGNIVTVVGDRVGLAGGVVVGGVTGGVAGVGVVGEAGVVGCAVVVVGAAVATAEKAAGWWNAGRAITVDGGQGRGERWVSDEQKRRAPYAWLLYQLQHGCIAWSDKTCERSAPPL